MGDNRPFGRTAHIDLDASRAVGQDMSVTDAVECPSTCVAMRYVLCEDL